MVTMTDQPLTRVAARKQRKPRRRVSVIGVIGELFITAGVVLLLSWRGSCGSAT